MGELTIQIDTREKAKAIKKIIKHFDEQGIKWISTKCYVGDYVSLENSRLTVDRKQNLTEVYGNVINDHVRFKAELVRAKELGIQIVILVEHGGNINCLEDVREWDNPRRFLYKKNTKKLLIAKGLVEKHDIFDCEELYNICKVNHIKVFKPPVKSEQLYTAMLTMSERYGSIWNFCNKDETGKRIVEILGERK